MTLATIDRDTVNDTPPPTVPDFSRVALKELCLSCEKLRADIQLQVEGGTDSAMASIVQDVQLVRDTLALLGKPGGNLLCNAILDLLFSLNQGDVAEPTEALGVLLKSGEVISDYVHQLQQGAADNSLNLLPAVNDCRAACGMELLSAALVVSAGIEIEFDSSLPLPGEIDMAQFQDQVHASRLPLIKQLLNWYRAEGELHQTFLEIANVMAALAQSSDSPTALGAYQTLFQSADIVSRALAEERLDNSAGLKKLFGQLERFLKSLDELELSDIDSLPAMMPVSLVQNLLYYVAISADDNDVALALKHEYQLNRFDSAYVKSQLAAVNPLNERLAVQIRKSIDDELELMKAWLSDDSSSFETKEAKDRVKAVTQLETVVLFLSAGHSLSALQAIVRRLDGFLDKPALFTSAARLAMAESLVRLEQALDEDSGFSDANRTHPLFNDKDSDTSPRRSSQQTVPARTPADDALQQLLRESQRRLLQIETDLGDYFEHRLDAAGMARLVIDEMERISSALMVVPLPEVRSLILGLSEQLGTASQDWEEHQREHAAGILIAVNYYLDCVLTPQTVASELLLDAEQALDRLRFPDSTMDMELRPAKLKSRAQAQIPASLLQSAHPLLRGKHDTAPHEEHLMDSDESLNKADHSLKSTTGLARTEPLSKTDQSLSLLSTIAAATMDLSTQSVEQRTATVEELRSAFSDFGKLAAESNSSEVIYYAEASEALLHALLQHNTEVMSEETLDLLDDSVAVLPQMIDRLQGGTEPIQNLESLLASLREEADYLLSKRNQLENEHLTPLDFDDTYPDLTQTRAIISKNFASTNAKSIEAPSLDAPISVDTELQNVFFRECATHLGTLEHIVSEATANAKLSLPSEDLLRALHTLSGCSQTVDAKDIVNIVQPLQKFAVKKHHNDRQFDAAEVLLIRDALGVLRERLAAMQAGESIPNDEQGVEARIRDLEAESIEGDGDTTAASDLQSVFTIEALDLFQRLRMLQPQFEQIETAATAKSASLGVLHTLKGSARMVGETGIADIAHTLEHTLQSTDSATDCRREVDAGLQAMERLLSKEQELEPASESEVPDSNLKTQAQVTAPAQATPSTVSHVSPDTFDRLLQSSTDVSVAQARLGDRLDVLKLAAADMENAGLRLQRLAQLESLERQVQLQGPAASEILADIALGQKQIAEQLRELQSIHAQASRSAKSLQQELIRTRLVRIAELRPRLEQVIRDTARDCGKQADFDVIGGEITLDKSLFQQLLPMLEHVVRNAVVHGIESESVRQTSGKQRTGQITLRVDIDGSDLVLSVTDDGGGVDVTLLHAAAERAGLDTTNDLTTLLTHEGFSSVSDITQQAGRGIGLSSVKRGIDSLGGQLHIASTFHYESTVTLRVPQTLVVNQVLQVQVGEVSYAIPVNFVQGVIDQSTVEAGQWVPYHDQHFKILPLSQLTSGQDGGGPISDSSATTGWPLVLVHVNGASLALQVDMISGYREIVSQPLGLQMQSLRRYSGGSVLADGTQVLILDLQQSLQRPVVLHKSENNTIMPDAPVALLADDSITMRFAAEKMLSKLGFEVRTARDGAEAWDELQEKLPTVLLIDIDMPKLSGFDVLERLNRVHADHNLPVIMISTQDSDHVYLRAQELGVSRFINKPYSEEDLTQALAHLGLMA